MEPNLNNVRIVLVAPIYGGNVGSVCRAMKNMGLSDLVIAAPNKLNLAEGRMMACAAQDLFKNRREVPTLEEAVSDCELVMGASARGGLYRSHSKTPREWAPKVVEHTAVGKVALIFGREDDGLTNEELSICTQIIQIPTSPHATSLNLAQAVMLCCYEVFLLAGEPELSVEPSEEAPSEQRENMYKLWRQALLEIGFMKEDKADHMMMGLRRILSRGSLSVNDIRILMGIARQTSWAGREAMRQRLAATDQKSDG